MSRSWLASVNPAPSAVERAEHPQPLLGLRRQLLLRLGHEEGVGPQLRASDAAADLVELRQPEHVGALDDQRVRRRDVEPRLDDRGREQHVEAPVVEGVHPLVEVGGGHLPVRDDELHLGHLLAQEGLDLREVGDPRHDVERLPAAIVLAEQRLAHGHRVELADVGADRQPVDRRRRDQAELAHARERQLQRPRDRRRGQGQHVDVRAQRLQPLLVGDAEMLLLVDDEQPEVAEPDALGEQRVGADHDLDRAVGEPVARLAGVLGARRIARAAAPAPAGRGTARRSS